MLHTYPATSLAKLYPTAPDTNCYPAPRPHSFHNCYRNTLNLSGSPGKHRTGWQQTQDTSRRRFVASKGSEAQVLTKLRQTYSERQGI
ncbi:hypothetical protein E2C01_055793 [Portunus trituberculatus]|uniref:Uncharacterized protein n=1 Tax=Portunus trituberculatus TaxID=210409 RepID=A0A5B7GXX5_PORTR|nr:hypothetical protein [Portunus trituberculatus]